MSLQSAPPREKLTRYRPQPYRIIIISNQLIGQKSTLNLTFRDLINFPELYAQAIFYQKGLVILFYQHLNQFSEFNCTHLWLFQVESQQRFKKFRVQATIQERIHQLSNSLNDDYSEDLAGVFRNSNDISTIRYFQEIRCKNVVIDQKIITL